MLPANSRSETINVGEQRRVMNADAKQFVAQFYFSVFGNRDAVQFPVLAQFAIQGLLYVGECDEKSFLCANPLSNDVWIILSRKGDFEG